MDRVFRYEITEKEAGMKICSFLKQQGFSSQNLIELKKRPDVVLIDGESVYLNRLLQIGERLTVHVVETRTNVKTVPREWPLSIVYEDQDILVVNKQAGMPIHISMRNYDNSLANALAWYYREEKTPFVFRCSNRLDRDTSGLTIVAKNMVSAAILGQMVAAKALGGLEAAGISREYLAIVRGKVEPEKGIIDAPLARKDGSVIERIVDYEQGEKAITHYRVLTYREGFSLVSLQLETGRTHQIRVHMKHIGYPLIGDYLYNPDMDKIGRQALHAWRMCFLHPITKEKMELEAPLPEDMCRVLGLEPSRWKMELCI